jgi:hypothetical protein
MKTEVSMDPNPISFGYNLVVDAPYPAFDVGDELTLSSEGGDSGGFKPARGPVGQNDH